MMGNKLEVLIETYKDCRTEIEQRISQRDSFTNQFIVTSGAVLSLGLMDFKYSAYLFFLLPLLSLFYTTQIMYSYSIHDRLHAFLCDYIEPSIAKLLGIKRYEVGKYLWENYSQVDSYLKVIKTPGIRKKFFIHVSYVFPFLSGILYYIINTERTGNYKFSIIFGASLSVAIFIFTFVILARFDKNKSRYIKKLCDCAYFDDSDKKTTKHRAVFLDRDGTIHIDKVQTHLVEDLEYFDDTISCLKKLYDMGFMIVIVTNQDGIKNGVYTKDQMKEFNNKIIEDLRAEGIKVAAIYYAPHDKKENHISFKPNPGMLIRASYDLNISLVDSYIIGDQVHDIIAGEKVGVEGIMVTTGIYNDGPASQYDFYMDPDYLAIKPTTCANLTEATQYIVDSELARKANANS